MRRTAGNQHVAKGLASLYACEEEADCLVVFCVKAGTPQKASTAASRRSDAEGPSSKKQRLADGSSISSHFGRSDHVLVGDPLPGHQLVLRFASERFGAQLKRWDVRRSRPANSGPPDQLIPAAATVDGRPVLRVVLSSEADESSARAAIRYAYTGEVRAASIREALQVRRQALNLRIEGCAEACMEIVKAKLAVCNNSSATSGRCNSSSAATSPDRAPPSLSAGSNKASVGDATGHPLPSAAKPGAVAGSAAAVGPDACPPALQAAIASAPPPIPPVLELFLCHALWPDPAEEKPATAGACETSGGGSFIAVVDVAKPQLVAYFGDALRTLNTRHLRQQLLELPPLALEVLLESDDFGTDNESSVLLLLATWMEANFASTDAATRERLCRLVRLVQLSRPYLYSVLPVLALDYENASSAAAMAPAAPAPTALPPHLRHYNDVPPAAWFPITGTEAAFITSLATAPPPLHDALAAAGRKVYGMDCTSGAWYCVRPRRQALPSASGQVFRWHIPHAELARALEGLAPGGLCCAAACFDGGFNVISAAGFEWWPSIEYRHGAADANLGLYSQMPEALQVPGSRFITGKARGSSGGGACGTATSGGGAADKVGGVVAVAGLDADLSVQHWQGDAVVDDGVYFSTAKDMWPVGGGRGANVVVLGHRPRGGSTGIAVASSETATVGVSVCNGEARRGSCGGAEVVGVASSRAGTCGGKIAGTIVKDDESTGLSGPLAAWAGYLRGGKVSGTLTLLPPSA